MFRNRNNSQKPSDDFIANFKANFGSVTSGAARQQAATAQQAGPSLDALDVAQLHQPRPHFDDNDDLKDGEATPRGTADSWRFTPSLLDPNSFAFSNFANQPPGYYTPTPGGTNTIYHNQAGDLHTPGFSMGLGTPLSMPNNESTLHAGQTSSAQMHAFNTAALPPHQPFSQNPFAPLHHQQQGYAPHHFQHQQPPHIDPSFGQHVDESHHMDAMHHDIDSMEQSPLMNFHPQQLFDHHPRRVHSQPLEQFRFHVTLNAPTAMIKHADEIPVTYLNKGQAYAITIVDTMPGQALPTPNKYRTFVRISFEDEQQRQKPSACWQLWKEGRGTNEAHHRGGRLQAVEFVESTQVGGIEVAGRPNVELESASFDGFVVAWTPAPNQPAECSVAVRFNFLSTDFSHSKGVKGIPVRLCAKTDVATTILPQPVEPPKPEVCYCKVKLFRDHGAERKLSNDIQHVKKTIEKLNAQIAQAESGAKDFGKRKRNSLAKVPMASEKPGKVPKHKRTWSISSDGAPGQRPAGEDDLRIKLETLKDMFSSTRPASVLYLRGEEHDDPEAHPVSLPGEPQDLTKIDTTVESTWEKQSAAEGSSRVSPTPSSTQSPGGRRESGFTQPTPFGPASRMSSNEWRNMPGQTATGEVLPTSNPQMSPPTVPLKIQKLRSSSHGSPVGWVEAVDVDYGYRPPPDRAVKPIACFYVQPRIVGEPSGDSYYRAVYLMQRTLKDMINGIANKCDIEPTQVVRTLRVTRKGLTIKLDDESVRELPEGQDMTAEFQHLKEQTPPAREWDAGASDIQVDGDVTTIENVTTTGYELKLYY